MAGVLVLSALGSAQGPITSRAAEPLIVHEWGTFTSVAGRDGHAINWLPLNWSTDLPDFVDRLQLNIKGSLACRVRMETPVLYFYTSRETDVDVKVRFRQGLVTEWFPDANVTPRSAAGLAFRRPDFSSSITWPNVRVSPAATADFPMDDGSSHYYAARQTDASPLRLGSQQEKFLFYGSRLRWTGRARHTSNTAPFRAGDSVACLSSGFRVRGSEFLVLRSWFDGPGSRVPGSGSRIGGAAARRRLEPGTKNTEPGTPNLEPV